MGVIPPVYGDAPAAFVEKEVVADDDVLTSPNACWPLLDPLST
jgi:hypothetical protein